MDIRCFTKELLQSFFCPYAWLLFLLNAFFGLIFLPGEDHQLSVQLSSSYQAEVRLTG